MKLLGFYVVLVVCGGVIGIIIVTSQNSRQTYSPVAVVPLDTNIVSTGGSAVTALKAGHRTGGGWILNPLAAFRPLCIIENSNVSGPSSCIAPGGAYNLMPSDSAVLVVSEDSYHLFAGYGMLADGEK